MANPGINPKRAGRPRADILQIFIIIYFQTVTGCSLEKMMLQLESDLFLMATIYSHLGKKVKFPARSTIIKYQQLLNQDGIICRIFEAFIDYSLQIAKEVMGPAKDNDEPIEVGQAGALDSSFLDVPIYKHSPEEALSIKHHKWEKDFAGKEVNFCSESQKDHMATWSKKNNISHHGHKLHLIEDVCSGLVVVLDTTPSNVHDSRKMISLAMQCPDGMNRLYGDSAYGAKNKRKFLAKVCGIVVYASMRAYANKPLSDIAQEWNRYITHCRISVEHVFTYIKNTLHFKIRNKSYNMIVGVCTMAVTAYNVSRLQLIIDNRIHRLQRKSIAI